MAIDIETNNKNKVTIPNFRGQKKGRTKVGKALSRVGHESREGMIEDEKDTPNRDESIKSPTKPKSRNSSTVTTPKRKTLLLRQIKQRHCCFQ